MSYDDAGVGELVSQMVDLDPALVLMESTGGLELSLVAALAAAALPVVVVNPRQMRDFAQGHGNTGEDRCPGRITRKARRLTLHLPQGWHWQKQFSRALARLRALPLPS